MTQDTYPIIIKPSFSLSKVIAIIFGIIILILWYKTCHPPKPVTSTLIPVTSISDQKAVIVHDSIITKKQLDSLLVIQDKLQADANSANFLLGGAQAENLLLQKEMDDAITQPVPDTCRPYALQIQALNAKLKQSTIDAQKACNSSVNAQKAIVKNKDGIIAVNNTQINNLRASVQTALDQQKKLQDNIKKIMPKSEIYAGIELIGNQTKPLTAYGINLGLKTKKGTYFEVGAFQMSSIIYYQASYKKTIFKIN